MLRYRLSLIAGAALLLVGCTEPFQSNVPQHDGDLLGDGGQLWPDIGYGECKAGQDADGDKIPDDVEGCGEDTDVDGIPNHMDSDADGDKVPDSVEAGPNPATPQDSDGDKTPDFLENDSDDDGLKDGDEDLNGDGLLGCCMTTCGEKREGCPELKPDECSAGQTCQAGQCQPPVHFLCSDGETDPKKSVTYPGSTGDKDLPTFICHDPDETSGKGLKPMLFKKSTSGGGWHLALEQASTYGDAVLANPKPNEAAATFDLTGTAEAVAGFIVSLPAAAAGDVSGVSSQLVTSISTSLPGKTNVSQLTSGTIKTSHDNFPTVVGTQLQITLGAAKNPPAVRNDLIALLLGRPAADVTQLPPANFGPSATELVLAFQTLLRTQENRVLVMGAVATQAMVKDATKDTGFHLDDLSNGTGLATPQDGDTVECDPFILENTPIADIIWIVDESGSMDDNRKDIVANATDFFNRALNSGLDFRMGVAGVKAPSSSVQVGKFCSKISSSTSDDGGTDRFLGSSSSEQTIFESCVKNPPYYEPGSEYGLAHSWHAVTDHLPRQPASANDQTKIRAEATLVLIIATDEAPEELKTYGSWNGQSGFLADPGDVTISKCTSAKQAQIDAYVKPWIELFQGKNATHGAEAKAIVHLIAGVCQKTCGWYGPEYPWGYEQIAKATGGQIADICQANLGTTLQLIIDSITGAASPAVLQYVPISASLAVALGTQQLARSRTQGFDYSSASNSLLFIGVPFKKGDQVVASYRRWIKQSGPVE
jgi:hypothetical protein